MIQNTPRPAPPGLYDVLDALDTELDSIDILAISSIGCRYAVLGGAAMARILRALSKRIEEGFPDVISADVRLIYENWLISHVLLESSNADIQILIRHDRYWRKQIGFTFRHADLEARAEKPFSTYRLAEMLRDKLKVTEAPNPELPILAYKRIFRNESYIGGHPSIASLGLYLDHWSSRVHLPPPAIETAEERLRFATIIVFFYASELFKTLEIEATEFDRATAASPFTDWINGPELKTKAKAK